MTSKGGRDQSRTYPKEADNNEIKAVCTYLMMSNYLIFDHMKPFIYTMIREIREPEQMWKRNWYSYVYSFVHNSMGLPELLDFHALLREVFDPASNSAPRLAWDTQQATFESSSKSIKKIHRSFLGLGQSLGYQRSTKVKFSRFCNFFILFLLFFCNFSTYFFLPNACEQKEL